VATALGSWAQSAGFSSHSRLQVGGILSCWASGRLWAYARVARNNMAARPGRVVLFAVVEGVSLGSGGQDNSRVSGWAVECGHVGCAVGQAGALVDVALVGYLARIQLRGVAEQHQPLDPP
jgi:hypothetical protein